MNDDDGQNILSNVENSILTMINYRSLYLLKEKIKINKEKLKEIYLKYNINKNRISQEELDYIIKKEDFAKVTEEIFQKLNLLILKFINPKDILLSGILYENKIEEMFKILEEIQNLINANTYSIEKYNSVVYNKKAKRFSNQKASKGKGNNNNENNNGIIDESNSIKTKEENINDNYIEINENNIISSENNNNDIINDNNKDKESKDEKVEDQTKKEDSKNIEVIKDIEDNLNKSEKNNRDKNDYIVINNKERQKGNETNKNKDDNINKDKNTNNSLKENDLSVKNETDNKSENNNNKNTDKNNNDNNESNSEKKSENNNNNNIQDDDKKNNENGEIDIFEKKEEGENKKEEVNEEKTESINLNNQSILSASKNVNNEVKTDKIRFKKDNSNENIKNIKINAKHEEKLNNINIQDTNSYNQENNIITDINQENEMSQNEEKEISVKILEYNRKGKVVHYFEEMEEENKKLIEEIKNKEKEIEEILKLVKEGNALFIEILPLILADFLQENQHHAIIEIESELSKDLYNKFDKQLLAFINEYDEIKNTDKEKIIKSKELKAIVNEFNKIKENQNLFIKILKEKMSKEENVIYIENMIEKLNAKEIYIRDKIKKINQNQNLSLLEKIKETNQDINNKWQLQSHSQIDSLFTRFNKNESKFLSNSLNVSNFTKNEDLTNNKIIIRKENQYDTNIFNINVNNKLIKDYKDKNNYTKSYNYSMSLKSLSCLPNKNVNIINSNISNISGQNVFFKSENNVKINKALEEIFYFYSKKHNIIGHNKLFENIEEKKKHLDLIEFSKFCKDFNIPISNQKLVEIFKKNSSNINLMKLEEFKNTVQSLSQAVFESNIKLIKENLFLKKSKLKKIEQRENQEIEEEKIQRIFKQEFNGKNIEKNIDNKNNNLFQSNNTINEKKKQKFFICQKNKLKNEIAILKNNYKSSINKSFKENFQSFCEILKLTSSNKEYRENMKGYKIPNLILNNIINKSNKLLDINSFKDNQKNLLRLNKKKNIILNKHRIDNKDFILSSEDRKYKGRKILIAINNNKSNNSVDDDLKNRIWWSKLKNYNIKELNMNDKDKDIFSNLDIIEDTTLNNINNNNISLQKIDLIRNKSDIDINTINKNKTILPPILNNKKETLDNKIKKGKIFPKKNDKKFVRLNNYTSMFLQYNQKLRNKSSVNISNKENNIN